MANQCIVIGSSNMRNIFKVRAKVLSTALGRPVAFKAASDYNSGLDAIDEVEPKQLAIVGFLTNELVDRCAGIVEDEAELIKVIQNAGMDYTEAIKTINKKAKIAVGPRRSFLTPLLIASIPEFKCVFTPGHYDFKSREITRFC